MDKFVEDAFKDALEQKSKKEFRAWLAFSENSLMATNAVVVNRIGQEKMNALCHAAIKAGVGDALAEYAYELMMTAFHIGYKAKETEGE